MKKYYIEATTPLKFYKVLKALLPISCVFFTFSFVGNIFLWTDIPQYYIHPAFWVSTLFQFVLFALLLFSAYNIPRMAWSGVISCSWYFLLFTVYSGVIDRISSGDVYIVEEAMTGAIASAPFLIPYWIYFLKRRPLFTPYTHTFEKATEISVVEETAPMKDVSPAEVTEKGFEDASVFCTKPPVKEEKETSSTTAPPPSPSKKHSRFHRYDTYIACPICGAMVTKGSLFCTCGYDFRTPLQKHGKKVLKCAVIILLLVACTLGSYFGGRLSALNSMSNTIELEYKKGYSSGYRTGYNQGHQDGYSKSKELSTSGSSSKDIVSQIQERLNLENGK